MGRPTTKLSQQTIYNRNRWIARVEWLRENRKKKPRGDRSAEYTGKNLAKALEAAKRWVVTWRMKAFVALGGPVCTKCGFTDIRALQFDHIIGGTGRKERKKYNGRMGSFYKYVAETGKSKFQVLCANCNTIKRHVEKEWGTGKPIEEEL